MDGHAHPLMLHPALEAAWYSSNPTILKFLKEWADGWLEHMKPGEYATSVEVATERVTDTTQAPNDVVDRQDRFQGSRVKISDVPQIPQRNDFAPPNYFHKGFWTVIVDGQLCVEEINFENENRVVACRRLAEKAAKAGEKVTVKRKIKQGIVA